MSARVLLVGLGDLGRRQAFGLADLPEVGELVLAGRSHGEGPAFAALVAACGTARVRFEPLDAADEGAVEALLRRERPDLIVQSATLLSPWLLPDRNDPAALALLSAGFALQLPAQLPLLRKLMRAAATVGLTAPVVNGSYPDMTHPILACEGLAPTLGIGNAGMIRARVCAALRSCGEPRRERGKTHSSPESFTPLPPGEGPGVRAPVRVIAHHAHITAVMLSRPPVDPDARPRVYLGEEGERADDLAYAEPPLQSERGLNALPAASALPLLRALLGGPPVRTSAPAPFGLPGGFPVRVAEGKVELDLPPGVDQEEAVAFQWRSARLDGVASVEPDGTVHFTEQARQALAPFDPELAEPLAPGNAEERFRRLVRLLRYG
jgi:hypothetical protein